MIRTKLLKNLVSLLPTSLLPVALSLALVSIAPSASWAQTAAPVKTFRYSFSSEETGFDPVQVSDLYSRIVTANIFEALYGYDYLARPSKVKPLTAAALPEVSPDFRTFTVKIKPGIYFADDPAFGGKKRELTAQDYVYSYKRVFDPKTKSSQFSELGELKFIGMAALRAAAEKPGAKFDYDKEIEGIRALDRYTIQFKLEESRPRLIYRLADSGIYGVTAREVVEKYGDKIMAHPVGTGPFMLKADEWVRSSKIVLVKNPNYREEYYDAEPPKDDPISQAIYQKMKGKRLPMLDRVEISIVLEEQPRWLTFLQNDADLMDKLPFAFCVQALPNNKLAHNLAKRGITMDRSPSPDLSVTYFNMQDPVVGGYTPQKVALRRAISLIYNVEDEIRLPRRNQAIPAQGPIMPGVYGYDPHFKTEMSDHNLARGLALLDMYGYVDKDGDGWRDMPDGKPLVIKFSSSPGGYFHDLIEIWKKNMDAAHVKFEFTFAQWPENLRLARMGKHMVWGLGYSASTPDPDDSFAMGYSLSKGENNLAFFENPEYDKLYTRQQNLPDGPERLAAFEKMVKILVAYMPYRITTHRVYTDLMQPWLIGYRKHPIDRSFWKYIDIDMSQRP